jgi:hypothetical protein
VNETAYSSVTIDSHVTASSVTGGNNGKYYTSDKSWRHYEGDNGAITIAMASGTLNSVTFTYGSGNNGVLKYSGSNVASGTECTAVNGETSATFSVAHSSGTKNGNVKITAITVTYTPAGSSPLDHITLSGTYPTEFHVGDAFSHTGLTVTAHFEDTSTSDVTGSATFTGYNMSTTGNQTVTVSYTKGAVTRTATYNITVLPALTAAVTLDFSSNSNWSFPTSKTVDSGTYTNSGYSITLEGSSGNGYYFDTSNKNLLLGKSGASLTLPAFGFNVSKIKVYGATGASTNVKFNVFVGDDPVSTEVTSSVDDHEFTIAAGKREVGTIYVIKVNNAYNMRITKIEIYGNGCEAGVVTDAGWATYVTTCDMEFAEGDAFVVSTANATTATLTGVTKIRANQPVLLKGEGAKTAKVLEEAPAAVSNELAISTGGEINGYVLAKKSGVVGFYKWAGGSLTSGKVYLPTPAGAREYLEFSFDNDVTAIDAVKAQNVENGQFFNLAGQRVAQPTKGLYIVNGRKVIIK